MKKITIFMTVAIVATLTSCTPKTPTATLKTQIDSLSYALGVGRTEGLYDYLLQQGIDTSLIDDVIRGINFGAAKTTDKDIAYFAGIQIGRMVGDIWPEGLNFQLFGEESTQTISVDDMHAGFIAAIKNDTTKMALAFAQEYANTAMEKVQNEALLVRFRENKEAGEKFLADNKGQDGVQITESGLQYKIIKQGKGEIPTESSTVKVHYKGTLIDGTEFESSYTRNEPSIFGVTYVIAGWTEALLMMPVGSVWELYIPQEIAYGSRESGLIRPFSTLIFQVELIGIEK
jgi:FKBP-type peptidyl-prolyl cis-trans isomerases 1